MKLMLSLLRRPAALAGLLLAMAAPTTGFSADQSVPNQRLQQPLGTRVQPVNYNCPNGDCYNGARPGWRGGWGNGWGGGWGGNCWGGSCSSCNGGGLFGCGCCHGIAGGNAWVRPPAAWPLSQASNTYNYYWSPRLAGVPQVAPPGGMPFPMVYQPTDTAQMGFYYRTVPRWGYRPEMLPAAPVPNWPYGMNTAYGGGWVDNGVVVGPNTAPPAANSPNAPAPAQQSPAVAPPPPVEPQVNVPEPEATFFPNRARR